MPSYCVVPFCKNRGGHRFPQDKELSKKWEIAVRREKWKPTKSSTVCHWHFKETDYIDLSQAQEASQRRYKKLKPGAVPSIFRWTMFKSETESEREKRSRERQQRNTDILSAVNEDKITSQDTDFLEEMVIDENSFCDESEDEELETPLEKVENITSARPQFLVDILTD